MTKEHERKTRKENTKGEHENHKPPDHSGQPYVYRTFDLRDVICYYVLYRKKSRKETLQ